MSDEINNGQEPQENPQPSEPVEGGGENDLYAGIPEDHPIRQEIERVRQESASRRVTLREREQDLQELQSKLSNVTELPEVQQLVTELQAKAERLEVESLQKDALREFKLPERFLGKLEGKTREEIFKDAEAWAEDLGTLSPAEPPQPPTAPKPTPRGGKSPQQSPDTPESLLAALEAQKGR